MLAPTGDSYGLTGGIVPNNQPLRILVIGAHPDDADIKAGGTSAKWSALGHQVKLVSVCDGSAGHQVTWGAPLAERRRAEAQAAASNWRTYEILPLSTASCNRPSTPAVRSFG